ncbi:hypothetical protein QQ045_008347 [Rhodiola kirilowii]
MGPELLEIHPQELTFVFELKKHSTDSVQLFNSSDQYIAFKVKTTSPKKYCVRPNIGIIKPKSTCDFAVTMQAQREAPPYMQCKDKFLVQSTIVPYGTKEEDITSEMFAKNSGKYIEEKKLRVVLISPSSEVIPVSGNSEKRLPEKTLAVDDQFPSGLDKPLSELMYKDEGPNYPTDIKASVLKFGETVKGISEPKNGEVTPGTKIEETSPETKNMETTMGTENSIETVDIDHVLATAETEYAWTQYVDFAEFKAVLDASLKSGHGVNVEEPKIEKKGIDPNSKNDVEALNSKLITLNMQLNESEQTITKLGEEQDKATKEIEMLKQELATLRQGTNSNVGQIYDGFPLLFVVMVALVSLFGGYLLRP